MVGPGFGTRVLYIIFNTDESLPHPLFLPSCPPKVISSSSSSFLRTNNHTAIREYDAKLLLAYWLERAPPIAPHAQVKTNFVYPTAKVAQIAWDPATDTITPDTQLPSWVFTSKLVAKPDQLIKRRGKAGLLALNKTWDEAKPWIAQRAGKPQKVRSRAHLVSPIYHIARIYSHMFYASRFPGGAFR